MPRRLRWLVRSRPAVAFAIGVSVFAAVAAARGAGWLVSWELDAYDGFLRARPAAEGEPPVTLVWIREQEIGEFGYPLPDEVLARALEAILAHQPRAVGLDVYRDRPTGEGWARLRDVFLSHPQLVAVHKLPEDRHPAVVPPPFLQGANQIGFADVAPDPDGVTRRGLLYLWDEQGRAHVAFSLQLALRYLAAEGRGLTPDPEDPNHVRIGPTTLVAFRSDLGGYVGADEGGYQYLLDYRRPRESFAGFSLSDALAGDFDAELVRDRVVLVGTASPSVKDLFQTPTGFGGGDDGRIYGAEHHAQAVDQLIRYGAAQAAPIAAWDEPAELAWILLWCWTGAAAGVLAGSPLRLLVALAAGLALIVGSGYGALARGLWIPVVPTALGGIGSLALVVAYLTQQERADKAQMRSLFSRFVSRRLVDQFWEDRDIFMEGGQPRPQRATVTVLLSDLLGYTTRSEKTEPGEVMDWLGTYMDRMAHLVEIHGGIVNDFLGDGVMASFGVPVPAASEEDVARDAIHAVECAVAMGEALAELNRGWRAAGQPTARLRVGILTGPAVIGTLGNAEERMKYATVGNTVNTAARLESFDKMTFEEEPDQSTFRILVGQATLERLGERYVTRCIGEHVLKGKGEPIMIHRVLGRAPASDPDAA